MGRRPATVIEYRSYELPSHFPMRIIAGEDWRISDVPCGVLHFHNCLEIGLCESDGGKIDFAGHVENFHAGDVTVIAGDVPHTTWSDAGTASKWAYLFCDPEELLRPFFALDTLPNARLLDGLLHGWCRVLSPQQNPALAPLVRQMLREMTQKGLNYQISVRGLFVAFITELMRLPTHSNSGSLTGSMVIAPALRYINSCKIPRRCVFCPSPIWPRPAA
jgi:AraC family transcriptional activator of mtrCDE